MPKKRPTKVYRYDGQSIWTSPDSGYPSYSDYELGSFLGGGAAGVVYEAECLKTKRHLAVKVLNPIGYKLAPSGSLRRFCEVVVKGQPYGDVGGSFGGRGGGVGGSGGNGGGGAGKMSEKHVWWLVNPSTRQTFAAYYDARTGILKEMTLPKCIEVWGLGDDKGRRRDRGKRDRDRDRIRQEDRIDRVFLGGEWLSIPSAPAKYDKFLRARASILREINNMLQLSEHPNILRLHEALELVQDSKATIFLVLELARGGELFDRIKVDCGADEGAARHYFRQLLSGVRHCHDRGVCHRDLKPENLLLADPDDSSVLKIADFGFSALFRELESESSSGDDSSGSTSAGSIGQGPAALRSLAPSSLSSMGGRARGSAGGSGGGAGSSGDAGGIKGSSVRRLKSVVGSPYYVAPEVLREDNVHGYDGTKADVWSMGVILYAMLAGNLPFQKELLACPRFAKFGAWARQSFTTASLRAHCSGNPKEAMDMDCLDYPSWFYPQHFSFAARSLLSGMLHPDASKRLSVRQALRHPWVLNGRIYAPSGGSSSSDGSDLGIGAREGEDERRAPDPQDIPSELLGADSDTDEELDGSLGMKGGRNQGGIRRGNGPPVGRPSVPVVFRPGRQDVGGAVTGVGVVAEAIATVTAASINVARGSSVGLSEGSTEKALVDTSSVRGGSRASKKTVVRQTSPPKHSHPPPSPAPPPGGRSVNMPLSLMETLTEAKEEVGRGRRGSGECGDVNYLEVGMTDEVPSFDIRGITMGETVHGSITGGQVDRGRFVVGGIGVTAAVAAVAEEVVATNAATSTLQATPVARPIKAPSLRSLDVFFSPPLAPLGPGRIVEEEEPEFLLDTEPPPSTGTGRLKNREGLPPSGVGHSRVGAGGNPRGLGAVDRSLTLGVAGMAIVEAEAGRGEGVMPTPPAFNDLVKRSTRFMTSVPAAVVLLKIAAIVNADAHPLPYPYRNIRQKAVVHQNDYKLEIMRGGVQVCTVQIYLLGGEQRAAQYMVEFLRGQLDIFLFKRFYEDVRCKLNDLVKRDYSLALLESGACSSRFRRFSNLA